MKKRKKFRNTEAIFTDEDRQICEFPPLEEPSQKKRKTITNYFCNVRITEREPEKNIFLSFVHLEVL